MTVNWKQTGDPMEREAWLGFEGDDTAPEWRITEKRGGQDGKGFIIEQAEDRGAGGLRWQSPYLGASVVSQVAEVEGGSDEAKDMIEYFKTCGA